FQNSKSNFKGQTFDLNEFANIFYSGSDEPYQKNSVYSRFSGRPYLLSSVLLMAKQLLQHNRHYHGKRIYMHHNTVLRFILMRTELK
ncbi:MAG: hypothetical protein AB1349_06405, partial [Elusimicrobiota bacterium]